MESPINPVVPNLLMKAALGVTAVATLASVYHQRYRMLASTDSLFAGVFAANSDSEKVQQLNNIVSQLQRDATAKKADARLSSERHGKDLLRLIVLKEDGSNAELVSAAARLLCRIFAQSDEGKQEMARLHGPKKLLKALSIAHAQGLNDPLEDLALALRELTSFDEEKVVLLNDVPAGSECAYELACLPSTASMLAILDPASPTSFLSAVVGVLTNVSMLHAGAKTIHKGCQGRTGMSCFLRLLDHTNVAVSGKAAEAVGFLCRSDCGRDELAQLENLQRIASNFSVHSEKAVINRILTTVMIMAGDKKFGPRFFELLPQTELIRTMFDIWVGSPDAETRKRAEMVACVCLQVQSTNEHAMGLLQRYRRLIQERAEKDEQEQQQLMRQKQMFQNMMMQQMGGDGGEMFM